MRTPVALFLFNRPDTVARVFARIAAARPPRLLLVADGPRPDNDTDPERCRAAQAVVATIDWPCEVSRLYSDVNLGCGPRMASGLSWVFTQVEEAIVFEDDCVPEPSFFAFCDELLDRYRHDTRVGVISGYNPVEAGQNCPDSYFFSRYSQTWGWASWRRVWAGFDHHLKALPDALSRGTLADIFEEPHVYAEWMRFFTTYGRNRGALWDYQFSFAQMTQSLLSIIPAVSQVSNVGCGRDDATNAGAETDLGTVESRPMPFPLRHPPFVVRGRRNDRLLEERVYKITPRRPGAPATADDGTAMARAWELYRHGDTAGGEALLAPRLTRHPDDPDALHLLGLLRHRAGRVNEGVHLIWRALMGRPDAWVWLWHLAQIYGSAGHDEVARDLCTAALRLTPGEPTIIAERDRLEDRLSTRAALQP